MLLSANSKAASTCGQIEARSEERNVKDSENWALGVGGGGWRGKPKAHDKADLEQKCIIAVCNLYSAIYCILLPINAWPVSVFIRDFMVFYAPSIS